MSNRTYVTPPRLRRATTALVSIAALSLALTAGMPVAARPHDDGPSTGLPGIAFDRVPPDVSFDTGDGLRPLHTRFGRPLVLVFWASWCGPCVAELDQFGSAKSKYGDEISILTFAWNDPHAATYLESRGLFLPVVPDPGQRVSKRFGVSAVPVTLVLRADGTLAHVSVGELDPGELDAALAALVPEPTPSDVTYVPRSTNTAALPPNVP